MARPDVLVVGAGVVGAACARALAVRGISVGIVDDGPHPSAATVASAGMLAPTVDARPDDPMLGLRVRGRDLFGELVPALAQETGIDARLWTEGILRVAFTEAEAARAKADVAWQRQAGLPADWLDLAELRERAPGISPKALGALLAPEDGALEPGPLREALLASALRHGARLIGEAAVALEVVEGRAVGIRTKVATHGAGAVLIAAGAWSGRLGNLPRPLSVEPVRGQMVALDWPTGEPGAILSGSSGYILRRGDELLAGSTVEFAGYSSRVTPDGRRQMHQLAGLFYPAVIHAKVRRSWAGLRPGSPDGRPFVGADPEIAGLWYATGHGRSGILLASVTGEIISLLVTGRAVEYDLTPVAPGRFWAR